MPFRRRSTPARETLRAKRRARKAQRAQRSHPHRKHRADEEGEGESAPRIGSGRAGAASQKMGSRRWRWGSHTEMPAGGARGIYLIYRMPDKYYLNVTGCAFPYGSTLRLKD